RDDAEVAAASTQAPEQVRVLRGAGGHDAAVGGHDIRLEQVVGSEAALALEPPAAAAEGEAGDAGGGEAAAGDREAVLLGGRVELAPGQSGLGLDHARVGIDLYALHRRQVDHDAVVAGGIAGRGVAAASHGHGHGIRAREVDGGDH